MTTLTAETAAPNTSARRDWLKLIAVLLNIIGLAISGYLVYTKLFNVEVVCAENGVFQCDLVQSTVYSKVAGIPVQFIGLAGYLAIFAVLLLEGRNAFFTKYGVQLVFGMTLFGFLFSGYLTAIEAFVIHAWCMWCLGSAITMTLLFIVSTARLWKKINRPLEELLAEEAAAEAE
jgi:uncharacterized membrane protein